MGYKSSTDLGTTGSVSSFSEPPVIKAMTDAGLMDLITTEVRTGLTMLQMFQFKRAYPQSMNFRALPTLKLIFVFLTNEK